MTLTKPVLYNLYKLCTVLSVLAVTYCIIDLAFEDYSYHP
jgi:hypothetical protein